MWLVEDLLGLICFTRSATEAPKIIRMDFAISNKIKAHQLILSIMFLLSIGFALSFKVLMDN